MTDMFLIEKRGLYYRPNAQGYTGLKSDAGRYTFEEAAQRVGPNGPDGSQDGMSMWKEDEAPEYSTACPWDLKMKDEAYRKGLADGAKILQPMDDLPYDETINLMYENGSVFTSFWYDQSKESFLKMFPGNEHTGPLVGWFLSSDLMKGED